LSIQDSIPSKKNSVARTQRHPLLRSLGWVVSIFIVFSLLVEGFARTGFAKTILPSESVGVDPTPFGEYFEIKAARLQQYVDHNGGVDVLLIGSSVVNTGIDPQVVADTYSQQTGIHLRIYNFGVESLDIVPNSVYAKILVQKYHPAVLIFGTIPRDYLASDNSDINNLFLASPWIEYEAGGWNLSGFLIAHSVAFQRYLVYRNWMRYDFLTEHFHYEYRMGQTSLSGYQPDNAIATNIDQHPSPSDPNEVDAFAKYNHFTIDPGRLQRLQDILKLQAVGGTQVIVMEIPLASTFYDYMGGQSVYTAYQQSIAEAVSSSGGLFLPSNGEPVIPPNGRSDREHLNHNGAPVLSTYLGNLLSALTKDNGMQFTHAGQEGH